MKKLLSIISQPWRVAIFLFLAAGLNYADRAALSSVVPPLRTELGATDVQIGLMGMLFLWTYAVCSPFAGNLADRLSRSRIVTWSLVIWSLVTLFTGFAWSVPVLYALRIALGFAESFYLPAAAALLGDHHGPATRGKAMGLHLLGLNLGVLVGGATAGVLAEHCGWRMGFWVLGGIGIMLAALSPFFIADGPQVWPVTATSLPKPKSNAGQAWLYLLRVPSFHVILFAAITSGVASWIFFSWLPLFFNENFAMNLGAAGLTGVALYKAPVVLGVMIGGPLSDKMARRHARGRVMIKAMSFLLSGPILFLMMGAPSFAVVAVILIVSSTIRAIGSPSEHPIICDVVPSQYRSTAVGILNTAGSAAGGVGVLLAGIFKKELGLSAIFGASSFLYIVAGVGLIVSYYLWVPKDVARAQEQEAHASPASVPVH